MTVVDEFNATDTATFDITIDDVNERPVAVDDPSVTTEEDMPVTFDVLGNDTDPDEGDTLTVMTITTQPRRGRVVADPGTQMLTYTPAKDDHDTYTFMYTARDDDPVRRLTSPPARVTVTVNAVNDAPEFATEMTTRTVSEGAQPGDTVGTKVAATDVDDITLTYSLSGASEFVIDASGPTGQISVAPRVTLDRERHPVLRGHRHRHRPFERVGQHHRHHQRLQRERAPDRHERHRDDRRRPVGQNRRARQRHRSRYGASQPEGLGADSAAQRTRTRRERPDHHLHAERELRRPRTASPTGCPTALSRDDGSVTVTVTAVNDAPTFPSPPAARSVPESAKAGANVGSAVTATDVDNAMLTYSLSGADASSFDIDSDGQITVATGVTLRHRDKGRTYTVTVTADDGARRRRGTGSR